MEIGDKNFKVILDDRYPVINEYMYKGTLKIGAGDAKAGCLTVNGDAVSWCDFTIDISRKERAVSYTLSHNSGYVIAINYSLSVTECKLIFTLSVLEDRAAPIRLIGFYDLPVLSVSDTDFYYWRIISERTNWVQYTPVGLYAPRVDGGYQLKEAAPDIASMKTAHACLYDKGKKICFFAVPNQMILPLKTTAEESLDFPGRCGRFSVELQDYHYRIRDKVMGPFTAEIIFLEDINEDRIADECDYQFYRNRMFPAPDPMYAQSLWYKIKCVDGLRGNVMSTFPQCLEIMKYIHNVTDGMPQIAYLIGCLRDKDADTNYKGFDEIDEKMGTLEEYLRFTEKARQYNCLVSHHFLIDEVLADAKDIDKDSIARNPDGSPRIWGHFRNPFTGKTETTYHYSHTKRFESGNVQELIRKSIDTLKLEQTVHLDAFRITNTSWEEDGSVIDVYEELECGMKPLLEFYKGNGIDVSTEGINGMPIDGPGVFSGFWHNSRGMLYHGKLIGGGHCLANNWVWGQGAAIDGDFFYDNDIGEQNVENGFQEYSFATNRKSMLDLLYLGVMLYKYYLEREIYEWRHNTEQCFQERTGFFNDEIIRIRFNDGTTAELKRRDDYLLVKQGDTIIAEGYNRFIPLNDAHILAYSRDGYEGEYVLPEFYRNKELELFTLGEQGRGAAPEYEMRGDSKLFLKLKSREPVKIVFKK